jgi:Protein of unknown function (DUF3048) N-terminal domain/Protein of unknown function (DUF3048) C-terminal domain
LLAACSGDDSGEPEATPRQSATAPPPTCPISGLDPESPRDLDRPAVAVKVENHSAAYPLSGLDKAEVVYEELVEGGITRFMAMYHCTDTKKAGPVRSARIVDPAIMKPITRILGDAGGNDIVLAALKKANIISIDENKAGKAMRRVYRPGYSSEHTLYASTSGLRKIGQKTYDKPPPDDVFEFGDAVDGGKKTRSVSMVFSGSTTVSYKWTGGKWHRSDDGEPLTMESGVPIAVDNVIIEQHEVNFSKTIVDVAGNRSVEIADVTGTGKAVLFRDGEMFEGRWLRKTVESAVEYRTKSGEPMVLDPGTTWIELLPDSKGELKGSYTIVHGGGGSKKND